MNLGRMKNIFPFNCLFFLSTTVNAQYSIPGASQQPAWVFPIYLEEGNGGRDTLYIGFDSTASAYGLEPSDSVFGVKVINIDTNLFNATWAVSLGWPGNFTDTAYKVLVTSSSPFPFNSAGTISFMNAIYPLKISWDISLLRSDSLPFADQGSSPRAQCEHEFSMPVYGDAYINGNQLYCGFAPLLITDEAQPWVTTCLAKDSVSFKDIFNTPGAYPNYLVPSFKTWTGDVVSSNSMDPVDALKLFPNPSSGIFTIKFNRQITQDCIFEVRDIMGSIIPLKKVTNNGSEVILDLLDLSSGIYFVGIKANNQLLTCHKLIILKN